MKNLHLLASFAYLYKNENFRKEFFRLHRSCSIMLDSGAFTLYNSVKGKEFINVNNYSSFLERYADCCEKYVTLDKVGDKEQTKRNYEILIGRGFKPMWVLTAFDNDFSFLNDTIANNENVCVAGGIIKGKWIQKRIQDVFSKTNRRAKIHGLAYVKMPTILQLPITSCDSSSFKCGDRFGNLVYFCEQEKKVKTISRREILMNRKKVVEIFNKLGVPSKDLSKNSFSGKSGLYQYSGIVAYLQLQKYLNHYNRKLFLAIPDLKDLRKVLYCNENLKALKYEDYIKE